MKKVSASDKTDRALYPMLQDMEASENGCANPAHGIDFAAFPDYVQSQIDKAYTLKLKPGYVPSTIHWLLDGSEYVGCVGIRHRLTDGLREMGGHIGYTIRKSCGGKGYGREILRLAMVHAREIGIDDVLLTCHDYNSASRRIIESNGGTLERMEEGQCIYRIEKPVSITVVPGVNGLVFRRHEGALGLYESVGYCKDATEAVWRKTLCP